MKRSTLNFWIDALMLAIMSSIVGIGFLIKYVLIPGQERWVVYGENVELYYLGMDRHEWGTIHLILGFVLLALLVLHIIFHWKVIVCLYNRIFQRKRIRTLLSFLFLAICTAFVLIPFLVKPEVLKISHGEGRHADHDSLQIDQEITVKDTAEVEVRNEVRNEGKSHKKQELSRIEVRGYMTLKEISEKYNVPTSHIKTKLNIPQSTPDDERLSRLRQKYGIEMNEVKEMIDGYK